MLSRIVEVTNGSNWGKFLVAWHDGDEWARMSRVDVESPTLLLHSVGHSHRTMWVLDLQTGEGAAFETPGLARADLDKHKVWVCPLYEPFLEWLYEWRGDHPDLTALPELVELPDAPFEWRGHRRPGPTFP